MSKGSNRRPYDPKKYSENYDLIFNINAKCSRCNYVFLKDDTKYDTDNGRYVCSSCFNKYMP